VVGVDKARQQYLAAGADDQDLRVFRNQLGAGADLGDDPVALQHRSVLDLVPLAPVDGLGEDGASADDAGGHAFSPKLAVVPAGSGDQGRRLNFEALDSGFRRNDA